MPAIEPLCRLMGICPKQLTNKEYALFEAELFTRICEQLKEFFREQQKQYFYLMKFTLEKENKMLNANLTRLITNDILSTQEYDLAGIACYADTTENVIQEIIDGRNIRPSATLLCRIIELHRSVRRDLYDGIIKKIIYQYLTAA